VRARTKTRSHTDVDDVWLRSVTSLSRKSALSLPELTKGRDGRFARTENPGDPWALPVLPGREDLSAAGQGLGTGGNVSLAETSAVMNATASPTRPAPVKSLDKLRADSSSEDDEEDEEQAHDVKKADEPIPTAPAVAASKPSAPDADDQEEKAEAPAEPPAQEPLANLPSSPQQQDAPPPAVAGPSAPSTDDATAAGLVDPEPALAATLDPREATQTAPDESAPAAEAAAAEAEGSHEPVEAAMPETTGEAEPASVDAAADAAPTQAPADE
jgi:ubiquinol-cytochrome c reductase cytochrome c1 subunit